MVFSRDATMTNHVACLLLQLDEIWWPDVRSTSESRLLTLLTFWRVYTFVTLKESETKVIRRVGRSFSAEKRQRIILRFPL